jgi:hypothetical protein
MERDGEEALLVTRGADQPADVEEGLRPNRAVLEDEDPSCLLDDVKAARLAGRRRDVVGAVEAGGHLDEPYRVGARDASGGAAPTDRGRDDRRHGKDPESPAHGRSLARLFRGM